MASSVGEVVEKRGHSGTADGNVSWYKHFIENKQLIQNKVKTHCEWIFTNIEYKKQIVER